MVKNVFYIEKEKFLRSMLEATLKAKVESIYTVETLENNQYLLEDLKPDLVIADFSSLKKDEIQYLLDHKNYKLVLSVEANDLELLNAYTGIDHVLMKPIVVNDLARKVLSF